jgi:methionyl-tRNA formyltransferase
VAAGRGDGSPLRVVFVGNADWSVPSLGILATTRHEVVHVLTRVPRPAGRGREPTPTPVATMARRLGLPLLETATVRSGEGFDAIRDADPDVLVVVAYGEILPESVLSLPRLMPVNLHFSLLPALRGAAPVQRAILEGLSMTGVTTIHMDAGMDTGPILLQHSIPIGNDEDAGRLGRHLASVGSEVLLHTLDALAAGTVEERPQDESAATLAPKLTPQDEHLDWTRPGEEIQRRVRALSPDPGTTTTVNGARLKVYRVSLRGGSERTAWPGTLWFRNKNPVVATGAGYVELEEVQPEGRKRMSGRDWANGARLAEGDVLGG